MEYQAYIYLLPHRLESVHGIPLCGSESVVCSGWRPFPPLAKARVARQGIHMHRPYMLGLLQNQRSVPSHIDVLTSSLALDVSHAHICIPYFQTWK